MGNLPLLQVLRDLGPSLPAGVQLNQIILASPDVDRDVFAYLAANLNKYGRGITLYCSANDRAMTAARRVAGGIPRAGDVPSDGPIVIDGIDTIDISATSTDMLALNHSIYAERTALLNDIGLLLQTGERPPDRRIPILQRVTSLEWRRFLALPGRALTATVRQRVAIRQAAEHIVPDTRIEQVGLHLPPWQPAAGGARAGDGSGGIQ